MNSDQTSFRVGHNFFSDLTEDERNMRNARQWKPQTDFRKTIKLDVNKDIPASKNWVDDGAVNVIQDQGQCGSCWAFGSVASMEGAHFIASGELLKFSEQQLVDCSRANSGCNGGLETSAFSYYMRNYAILESEYAYKGRDGTCQYDDSPKTDVIASDYTEIAAGAAGQIKTAVAQ